VWREDAGGGDLSGVPPAIAADSDDHDGSATRGLPLALVPAPVGAAASVGITIVGGLLLSQLLTLFTTPVVYLAFDSLATSSRGIAWGNVITEPLRNSDEYFCSIHQRPVGTSLLTWRC